MKPPRIVTYCDFRYVAKAAALLASLRRWAPGAKTTVLALDELTARILEWRFGSHVEVLREEAVVAMEPRLAKARDSRTAWEFYATQKPVLLREMLRREKRQRLLAYIDADTFFFSRPDALFAEMEGRSIGLSPHRFHAGAEHLAIYGPFNAGFCLWRNDPNGRQCLAEWSEECLAWCQCEADGDGRFMNQGYLAEWPARYAGVVVIEHPGANLAPWNLSGVVLERGPRGTMRVEGKPLVFFHFSAMRRDILGQWDTYALAPELLRPDVGNGIFAPYLAAVETESRRIYARWGVAGLDSGSREGPSTDRVVLGTMQRERWGRWRLERGSPA
jgi:hypothetical protein